MSINARSILCPGCHQSLPTEDEKVKEYCARREFFSEGTITVTKKGTLIANVRVRSLTIQGEVKGPVRSREAIHVRKTGRLYGDFTAPILRVEAGAKIIGIAAQGVTHQGQVLRKAVVVIEGEELGQSPPEAGKPKAKAKKKA